MTDLRALLRQFETAENSNDSAAIVSAMADDVVMIVPAVCAGAATSGGCGGP
jgi:ketosteroid isomerase-like protein